MAHKGRFIFLTVLIVLLLYVLSLIIITRPDFEESVRNKVAEKSGVIQVPEIDVDALVKAEVAKQMASYQTPQSQIQAEVAKQVAEIEIPQPVQAAEVDVDAIVAETAEAVLENMQADYIPLISDYVIDYQADHPELSISDIEPYIPTITKQVSDAVYAKIPEIAEQLLPALETYVPQITDDVYPKVLDMTLETFSDSQQLQKTMLEWMVDNEDQLVKDIINQIVSSVELNNSVQNIIVSEADSISPEIIKALSSTDSQFMSKTLQKTLENNPELVKQIATLVAKQLPSAHVLVASGPVVDAGVPTPAADMTKTADEVAQEKAEEVKPEKVEEVVPAKVEEPAKEILLDESKVAKPETSITEHMKNAVNTEAFFTQGTDVIKMTNEEYQNKESTLRQSIVDSFKSKLKN